MKINVWVKTIFLFYLFFHHCSFLLKNLFCEYDFEFDELPGNYAKFPVGEICLCFTRCDTECSQVHDLSLCGLQWTHV